MTSHDNTVVGRLSRSTNRSRTSTNLRQVVGHIHTEAVPVLERQTVTQSTRITKVSIQEARVFVHQDFHHDRVDNQPAASLVHVLLVQKTAHTVNQHHRGYVSRRESRSTRKTCSNRNSVTSRTSRSDVAKRRTRQLHGGQKFIRTSGRDSLRTIGRSVHGVSIGVKSRLSVTRQVAKNFLVILVSQTISRTVRGKVHKVDVRVLLLDVINFKGKVISLVDNQREVLIRQVLSSNLRTTGIRSHRNFRLFDDLNGVAVGRDFTKIIRVSNVAHNGCFTQSHLDFLRVDNGTKVTVRKVAPTGSRLKSHDKSPLNKFGFV